MLGIVKFKLCDHSFGHIASDKSDRATSLCEFRQALSSRLEKANPQLCAWPLLHCSTAPVIIGLFGSRLMFTDSEEHHAVSSDHSNNATCNTKSLQFQREQDGCGSVLLPAAPLSSPAAATAPPLLPGHQCGGWPGAQAQVGQQQSCNLKKNILECKKGLFVCPSAQ